MPASIDVTTTAQRDMDAVHPLVKINGELVDWITVTAIEDSTGILPSRAMLRLGGNQYDIQAPVTLNRFDFGLKRGMRVEIFHEDEILFLGNLTKRQDQDDEGGSVVMWEAVDDRWLLAKIPVRGCLVYDPSDATVKHIARYVPRTNPGGKWNCRVVSVNGGQWPVFTWTANVGRSYESPVEVFSASSNSDELTAWTPRRFLQYLQLLVTIDPQTLPGAVGKEWRTIYGSSRLMWDDDALQISGTDSLSQFDPLDRKMPDVSFRGEKVLGAIEKTLRVAGTHGLRVNYSALSPTSWRSKVQFYPKGYTGLRDGDIRRKVIPLQRSGTPTDVNTAFAFNLHEDSEDIAEAVLVEGAPVHVEASLGFTHPIAVADLGTLDYGQYGDKFKPAWSAARQLSALRCINGSSDPNAPGDYAWYPSVQGSTVNDTFADGGETYLGSGVYRPYAESRSEQAVSLMRDLYPEVFRAWFVDSEYLVELQGKNSEYADDDEYPKLGVPRPILDEQLQFYVETPNGGNAGTNRIQKNVPVRIEVKASTDPEYVDAQFAKGLKVDGNGLTWLDGLAENVNGQVDCVYEGDIQNAPLAVIMKKVRINCAFPADNRVLGYAEVEDSVSDLDPTLATDMGGPPLEYIDSPEAYHEKHQINSVPMAVEGYYDGNNLTSVPLNRYLPPGSEITHALDAAKRRLSVSRFPRRQSSWQMIGIRPEFRAGDWIDKVKLVNPVDGEGDYDINAPLETVTYDFLKQRTVLGGLVSQLPSTSTAVRTATPAAPAAALPVAPPMEDVTDAPGQLPPTREIPQFRNAGMSGIVGEAMGI